MDADFPRRELPRSDFPRSDWFEVPHRVKMGLSALRSDAPWLEIDAETPALLERKRLVLEAHRAQTSQALPGSEAAQSEARHCVASELARRRIGPTPIRGARSSLEEAALQAPEDLCVLAPRHRRWHLTAACVCFPTRWDLPSKMGRSLASMHAAVPGYAGHLAGPADRFFDRMKPGRIFERRNWSLLDDPELYQPVARRGGTPDPELTAANAGRRVWLRVERQTLRRLPHTGAVLFTIRIHQDRLAAIERRPEAAAALAASIRSMPADFAGYKALSPVRVAVLDYADAVAARPGAAERAC